MKSIRELLAKNPVYTVDSSASVYQAVLYMAEKGIGLVPVLEEGKLVGVFSERDLVKRVIAAGRDLHTTKVSGVMTTHLILASADEQYESLLIKMAESRIRHMLIVEKDTLIGVISMRDLMEIDISAHKETVEVLNHYIYSKYSFDIEANQ